MKTFLFAFSVMLVLSLAARGQALTNLARTGSPSASSQGYGTVTADGNDGNRNGNYALGSVFHTLNEGTQSFWQVNLGGVRFLDHVRIFNRVDAVQGSVANFRIIAKNGGTEVFNQIFLPANATDQNNARAWGTARLFTISVCKVPVPTRMPRLQFRSGRQMVLLKP